MRGARWLLPAVDPRQVDALCAALHMGAPACKVLAHRGFSDPVSARRFLAPSLDELHDPLNMRDMPQAVARLRKAIRTGERILIYGDYDVDGTSSVVLLHKAIALAGGTAGYHVPHRLKDGYGMRPAVVEAAAADGVGLIVSVDTGIRATDVVRRAAELAIDVIVTDHHLPETELPPSSTTTQRPVFRTEATIVAVSIGRSVRRSITSAEMFYLASSSAALSA